ncbi:hypothetical protein BASA81_001092 [Batrachochytrium salamandrivorans]|nr:hypothetical protein BASA81_001092 [Batrachochytrium salamandrivorans]
MLSSKLLVKAATTATRVLPTVLGIESSCDDSCAAILENGLVIRDVRISQFHTHSPYGGIMPNLAVREHERNMPLVLEECLAGITKPPDLIAVSIGPGMKACLRVGMNHALRLGKQFNVPVLGVNHLEAHSLVARQENPSLTFPYLCLLVSGGHTCLTLVTAPGKQQELGSTLDDAMGEAFDKVIRQLQEEGKCDNNHPLAVGHGGAALEQLASQGRTLPELKLPIALRKAKSIKSLDFSFSGLKASTTRTIAKGQFSPQDVALAFQTAAVEHCRLVVGNTLAAHPTVNKLVICGGVASNQALRLALENQATQHAAKLYFPSPKLCVDNGVMVAWCGLEHHPFLTNLVTENTNPLARWPLSEL